MEKKKNNFPSVSFGKTANDNLVAKLDLSVTQNNR